MDGHADPAVERLTVVQKRGGVAAVHDSPMVEDERALRVTEGLIDLLFDDDNGDAGLLAQVAEGAQKLLSDQRREALQRLVEQ